MKPAKEIEAVSSHSRPAPITQATRVYDPLRSIGRAILLQAETLSQREVLRDLVETYPGMLLISASGNNTGFNPVLAQMDRILAAPQARQAALAWVKHLLSFSERLNREFPGRCGPEKRSLDRDIAAVEKKLAARYSEK